MTIALQDELPSQPYDSDFQGVLPGSFEQQKGVKIAAPNCSNPNGNH